MGEMTRRLLDMKGAAGYLGMSKGFVEKEIREGRLQVLHLGRVRRIDVLELNRYIDTATLRSGGVVGNVGTISHYDSTSSEFTGSQLTEKIEGAR